MTSDQRHVEEDTCTTTPVQQEVFFNRHPSASDSPISEPYGAQISSSQFDPSDEKVVLRQVKPEKDELDRPRSYGIGVVGQVGI